MRIEQFRQSGNAGSQAAAPHRNEYIIHRREIPDDLHHDGALACRNGFVIERMDKSIPFFLRQLQGVFTGLIVHIAVQDHFGA